LKLDSRGALKKLDEYLRHAAECHEMARTSSPSHRQQLENMASTWQQLAEARKRQLAKIGLTAEVDEDP
jgi:hypothetical protein